MRNEGTVTMPLYEFEKMYDKAKRHDALERWLMRMAEEMKDDKQALEILKAAAEVGYLHGK